MDSVTHTHPVASAWPPAALRAAGYLRSLDPGLSQAVWTLEAGMVANALGSGMVLPFLVIYLHNVRGLPLGTAGLVMGLFGATSLVATSLAGALLDRLGARATLAGSLALSALGYGLFPLVRAPWQAAVFMALAGVGNGGFWPSQSCLLTGLTPPERRHSAFAVNRAAYNLGIGVGGLAGGLLATTSDPQSYTVLFLLDAATFLAFAATLVLVPPAEPASPAPGRRAGRYADVLRHRVFLAVVGLNVLFVVGGFAQLETTLPAYAKNDAGLSERAIGVLFLLNVVVIVLAQLPITKLLAGRRRMRALALMTLVWAGCWLLVLAAGLWLEAAAAGAVLTLAIVVFAFGECLHAPNQSGLVADLAVPALRGRYFALSTNSYALGFTVGPALGGFLLAASPLALWLLAAAACLGAGALGLALERRLPEAVRLTPA